MFSSGISAISTASASNTVLITIPSGASYNRLVIVNEGGGAGFFSVDGGSTWGRISAAASATAPVVVTWFGRSNSSPLIKRDTTTNLSAIYAFADEAKL